jgi:outer membrane immunogenic protein
VVAPIYNWGGFYLGLNGGGGSAHKCWTAIAVNSAPIAGGPQVEGCHNATGGTFGGQIGYRWQATNWVFGVEAQGNWADFTGHNANLAALITDDRTKMDAFGLFTGQVGYAWNNVLFYVKGGAAVVDDSYSMVANASSPFVGTRIGTGAETRWGGTAGVGVEFGFAPGWSVGVEYDHLWLGTTNTIHTVFPTPISVGETLTQRIAKASTSALSA